MGCTDRRTFSLISDEKRYNQAMVKENIYVEIANLADILLCGYILSRINIVIFHVTITLAFGLSSSSLRKLFMLLQFLIIGSKIGDCCRIRPTP